MKPKELSDAKLVEFIDSIFDWNRTGVLDNEEFRTVAEAHNLDKVFSVQQYADAVLTEGSRRYVLFQKQKQRT